MSCILRKKPKTNTIYERLCTETDDGPLIARDPVNTNDISNNDISNNGITKQEIKKNKEKLDNGSIYDLKY